MHMIRHYDYAMNANLAPVVVQAMMQYLRAKGFGQDQMVLGAERQEDRLALNPQMRKVAAVLGLAGLGQRLPSRGRLGYTFELLAVAWQRRN